MGSLTVQPRSVITSFPPGIHVPTLTWFKDDAVQSVDWNVQEIHLKFLIESGLHGIVIAGTNGEAATLSRQEKLELIRRTREIARSLGKPDLPITVGCNGGCTQMVIEETIAVAEAGADYALVLVPSYFHFAMTSNAIIEFFLEVAERSPIPIVVYNFPGVVSGLDVGSDMLDLLGEHPNIVAVKLTCGSIAKVARVSAKFGAFDGQTDLPSFTALAGQSDWLVPALAVGGSGCITGLANLYPKACIKMYDLWLSGQVHEASRLQIDLSRCEIGFGKGGINGTKWVVAKIRGYPSDVCHCRRPYPQYNDPERKSWLLSTMLLCSHIEQALVKV